METRLPNCRIDVRGIPKEDIARMYTLLVEAGYGVGRFPEGIINSAKASTFLVADVLGVDQITDNSYGGYPTLTPEQVFGEDW